MPNENFKYGFAFSSCRTCTMYIYAVSRCKVLWICLLEHQFCQKRLCKPKLIPGYSSFCRIFKQNLKKLINQNRSYSYHGYEFQCIKTHADACRSVNDCEHIHIHVYLYICIGIYQERRIRSAWIHVSDQSDQSIRCL